MEKSPLVSIIMPVYNGATTIAASLNSVLSQTLRDVEVIVVNDASTDGTVNVVNTLAASDSRLHLINLPLNVGAYEARAAGIRAARATYVGFVDADDFAKPAMFRLMLEACEKNQADIAVCGVNRVTQDRKLIHRKVAFTKDETISEGIFPLYCQLYLYVSLWNKLFRKELIMQHASSPLAWRQDHSEDSIVNIGCFLNAGRISILKEPLYDYVSNPDSVTRSSDVAKSYAQIFRAYALALELYGDSRQGVRDGITELFGRQLRYDWYSIQDIDELREYELILAEAVSLIARVHPIGLAHLANMGLFLEKKTFRALLTYPWVA